MSSVFNALSTRMPTVGRIVLGLIFSVFGLNGFLGFLPMPPMPGPAGELLGAFVAAGYMFPLIKGTEVAVGLLLLSGRFVPLALTVLAPVTLNIVAFHLFLAPAGLIMPLMIVALHVGLAYAYRDAFRGLLSAKAQPVAIRRNRAVLGHAGRSTSLAA